MYFLASTSFNFASHYFTLFTHLSIFTFSFDVTYLMQLNFKILKGKNRKKREIPVGRKSSLTNQRLMSKFFDISNTKFCITFFLSYSRRLLPHVIIALLDSKIWSIFAAMVIVIFVPRGSWKAFLEGPVQSYKAQKLCSAVNKLKIVFMKGHLLLRPISSYV